MTDVPKSIHADVWVGSLWVRIAAGGVDFGYALLGKIENVIGGKHYIIRAMPNTACAFGKGVTAIYAEDQNSVAFKATNKLFTKVGHVLVLQSEDEMHRFTSIIGSGQAFLFQVLNTYLQELKKIASTNQDATKLMFQDFVSSLGDSFSQEQNFESLINKIKSPGGTTQAGLESLETNNLDKILKDAFQAAEDRSIEISNEQ